MALISCQNTINDPPSLECSFAVLLMLSLRILRGECSKLRTLGLLEPGMVHILDNEPGPVKSLPPKKKINKSIPFKVCLGSSIDLSAYVFGIMIRT